MSREEKVDAILGKIRNKVDTIHKRVKRQKAQANKLVIIMGYVGNQKLLKKEEKKYNQLAQNISKDTDELKNIMNVFKKFFKTSQNYTDQEINGMYRDNLTNIINYVKTWS